MTVTQQPSLEVLQVSELASDAFLLSEVVNVINAAFKGQKTFESDKLRYEHDMQMPEQLGDGALCAIMRSNGRVIATASFIAWRPMVGGVIDEALKVDRPLDYELAEKGLSWEVKAVATVDAPESRSKGLVNRCINALITRVVQEHPVAQDGLLLWVQCAEIQAAPYWLRRGFELVGPKELKPKGMWGSPVDFSFMTMVKKIRPD